MLQTISSSNSSQPEIYGDREQGLDLGRLFTVFRRRIFYFAIPFVLILVIGILVVAIQRPIYHAEGKVLVESAQIPNTLVQPTVLAVATERIQVIQQRIMTRDNLLSIIKKFGLFPSEQRWMSGTQLLDLMRQRAEIQLVDIDTELAATKDGKPLPQRFNNKSNAVAFTMSFNYENPELAMKVANEFLTLMLNEDVRARTNRAVETTQFLAREVKRIQTELETVDAQFVAAKRQLADSGKRPEDEPEQLKAQKTTLTAMKTDLIKFSSGYSEGHPAVKNLKKRIAALEKEIADSTKVKETPSPEKDANDSILALAERQAGLQKQFDEAIKKVDTARLGENMERDQQAEHLQVIEQPALPQKPIKPNRPKLFAAAFGLAMMIGIGSIFAVEILDKTIHGSRDLAGVIDSHSLVLIPYITTVGEVARRKRRIIMLWVFLAILLIGGVAAAYYIGIEIDSSWFDRSWIDSLRRLSK